MSPASGRKAVRFRRFPGSVGSGRGLSSGGSMNRRKTRGKTALCARCQASVRFRCSRSNSSSAGYAGKGNSPVDSSWCRARAGLFRHGSQPEPRLSFHFTDSPARSPAKLDGGRVPLRALCVAVGEHGRTARDRSRPMMARACQWFSYSSDTVPAALCASRHPAGPQSIAHHRSPAASGSQAACRVGGPPVNEWLRSSEFQARRVSEGSIVATNPWGETIRPDRKSQTPTR